MQQATIEDDRQEVYELAGLGGLLGIGKPPYGVATDTINTVRGALAVVLKFDDAVAKAKNDKELTAVGRANRLKPEQERVLSLLDLKDVVVADRLRELNAEEKSVYRPVELDPADAVGAIGDYETRTKVYALIGEPRLKFWAELGEGKHRRVLDAILRDPFPSPDREQPERINRELTADALAPVVEAWRKQRADLEWGRGALAAMRQRVVDGLHHGVGPSA